MLCAAAFTSAEEPSTTAAAVENPFRLAKVGDWVEWKTTTQVPSGKEGQPPASGESHVKETVRTIGPKLLAMQIQILGQAEPVFMETQYSLERPYRPEWLGHEGRIEAVKEATRETRDVNGQKLECERKELKMTGADGVSTLTVWYHPDIPFGGIARMELHAANGATTIREALAFGHAASK